VRDGRTAAARTARDTSRRVGGASRPVERTSSVFAMEVGIGASVVVSSAILRQTLDRANIGLGTNKTY
jgi:hypothetical protein